ncbi:endonuclease/exonuclease/phosphatase family protein [Sphingomonas astaxanthinifaciens]|uniref:Endonuclease n=1 Tax=Sphingomonas astaxanthinifaciens DSM 22298 TaxID=1123267 RepID=A0ABQ5Z404_9SPHN|nr:endonuclease/exonuclease/phosphatase family protein [Sphingomonas astaxanthinifaciens]GLR46684.1 endonuclease [Sphingomonas astaxanthinifaciens DSM 22298]
MTTTLTVASYNMRKAVGLDRRRDPHRILHVLEEIGADVVALQEADRRTGGRASAVPHELWEGHSPYRPLPLGVKNRRMLDRLPKVSARVDDWLKVDTRNIGWHGNAILVKSHVGVLDVAAIELPTLEPRGAVLAELLVHDRPIRVVGLHLDLSGLWRRRQMRAILECIDQRPQAMPTVLMGDTNEWRSAAGCLKELDGGYRIAPTGPSFHARRPIAVLDRIMIDNTLPIEAAGVHHSERARIASDHLPIWARVRL